MAGSIRRINSGKVYFFSNDAQADLWNHREGRWLQRLESSSFSMMFLCSEHHTECGAFDVLGRLSHLRPSFVRPFFQMAGKTQRSTAAFLRLYSTFAFEFPAISPHFHLREIIFWVAETRFVVAETRLERMTSRLWAWRATNCSTPRCKELCVVPCLRVQR